MSGSIACVACHVLVHSFSSVTNSQICSLRQRQSTAPAASFLQALHVSRAIFTPPLISSTPSSPDDACRCCPVIFWCTNSIAKQVTLHAHPLNPDIHVPRHTSRASLPDWADHTQRLQMLGDVMRLTEQFKFESGARHHPQLVQCFWY